jgi:Protein of unknown function (DUF2975)
MHVASVVVAKGPAVSRRYRIAGRLLRVALVILLLGSVFAQTLIPVQATMVGTAIPEVEYLVVPYSLAAILFIVCLQVALVVVWRLLSLVDGGLIFTHRALRWVDTIIVCAAVATGLSAAVLVHMVSFVPGNGGPTVLFMVACIAGGLAVMLLVIVMRGLLEAAIDLAGPLPRPRESA